MIVKTKRWKTPQAFGKLIAYVQKSREVEGGVELFHNLSCARDLTTQFLVNDAYRAKRKNGVAAYHDILSFHPLDSPHLTVPMLEDLAERYMALRGPDALCYVVSHHSEAHTHLHFVFSGNTYRSSQTLRLGNAAFRHIRKELERYQRTQYPMLKHSVVYLRGRERGRQAPKGTRYPSDSRAHLQKRVGEKGLTKKERLAHIVSACFDQASGLGAFNYLLGMHGIEVYARGASDKLTGVIAGNRKWRFRTLSAALEAAIRREEALSRLGSLRASERKYEPNRGRERSLGSKRD